MVYIALTGNVYFRFQRADHQHHRDGLQGWPWRRPERPRLRTAHSGHGSDSTRWGRSTDGHSLHRHQKLLRQSNPRKNFSHGRIRKKKGWEWQRGAWHTKSGHLRQSRAERRSWGAGPTKSGHLRRSRARRRSWGAWRWGQGWPRQPARAKGMGARRPERARGIAARWCR